MNTDTPTGRDATRQFLIEYRHGGSTWALDFYAVDWQDAERKLQSIGANGRVVGECQGRVEVPRPFGPVAAFFARLFGAKA